MDGSRNVLLEKAGFLASHMDGMLIRMNANCIRIEDSRGSFVNHRYEIGEFCRSNGSSVSRGLATPGGGGLSPRAKISFTTISISIVLAEPENPFSKICRASSFVCNSPSLLSYLWRCTVRDSAGSSG